MQLVISTARGDILVCGMSGEFQIYIPDSPRGKRIDSILPYSSGLIFGGANGKIWVYEGTEHDTQVYVPSQTLYSGDRDNPKDMHIEPKSIG